MNRSAPYVDVHLVLRHAGYVLLGRQTFDNEQSAEWRLPVGLLAVGESATQALARAARAEIGIWIDPADARFAHLSNSFGVSNRLDLYFSVARWRGRILNEKPQTCESWEWFRPEELPDGMASNVKSSLINFREGLKYSEHS